MNRLVAVLSVAVAAAAFAEDLKPGQEAELANFTKEVQTNLDALNEACGTKLTTVQSDFAHYDKTKFTSMHPGQVCQSMLLGVKMVCGTPAYKKAVASKVKGLACLFAGVKVLPPDRENTREKANLSFEKGVFTYRLDTDHAGAAIAAKQVLEAALDK